MSPTVSVRVVLSVEVDSEQWKETYGDPPDELREEVRNYAAQILRDSAAGEDGAVVGVEVKR